MNSLYILVGIVIGLLFPIQATFGAKLNANSNNKLIGSFIAFILGTIVLIFINLVVNPTFFIQLAQLFAIPLIYLIGGGIVGVLFNVLTMELYRKVGAFYTSIFTFVGQILMGIIIDGFGLFAVERRSLSLFNIIGIIIMIAAVILSSQSKKQGGYRLSVILVVSSVLLGVLPPLQQVFNGNLSTYVGSPLSATLISFMVGAILLTIIILIKHRKIEIPKFDQEQKKIPLVYYFGGFCGILILTGNILVLPHIGSTITIFTGMLGQMLMAMAIDHYGLFGLKKQSLTKAKLISLLLMIVGILIVNL